MSLFSAGNRLSRQGGRAAIDSLGQGVLNVLFLPSDHALKLHRQLLLRRDSGWRDQLHSAARPFLAQQELISVFRFGRSASRPPQLRSSLQPPDRAASLISAASGWAPLAFVLEYQFRRHDLSVLLRVFDSMPPCQSSTA
jgi:hypothetical protein